MRVMRAKSGAVSRKICGNTNSQKRVNHFGLFFVVYCSSLLMLLHRFKSSHDCYFDVLCADIVRELGTVLKIDTSKVICCSMTKPRGDIVINCSYYKNHYLCVGFLCEP